MKSLEHWIAQAFRVLIGASRANELSLNIAAARFGCGFGKDCSRETPKPTRETRALPR
jgi:hypothetical protein